MPKVEPKSENVVPTGAQKLLTEPVHVINVGLEGFATELKAHGTPVTHVQWSPPAGGDEKLHSQLP
jgi:hypothetical protein